MLPRRLSCVVDGLYPLRVPRQRAMLMTESLEAGDGVGASSLEAWGLLSRDSSRPPPLFSDFFQYTASGKVANSIPIKRLASH